MELEHVADDLLPGWWDGFSCDVSCRQRSVEVCVTAAGEHFEHCLNTEWADDVRHW